MLPWDDKKGFRHWLLSSLLNLRWAQLLDMINFPLIETSLILDLGCNVGYLTRPLSLRAKTIGLDIDKSQLCYAKECYNDIEFICCDLCHLPLKSASVDVAVCGSVFEHIENLGKAIKEIETVLKKEGRLAVGYPIETKLLELIIKSFWRDQGQVWDQSNISKHKERLTNPDVHKQDFTSIRKLLKQDFGTLKRQKIPINYFPDFLSIYENVIFEKRIRIDLNSKRKMSQDHVGSTA